MVDRRTFIAAIGRSALASVVLGKTERVKVGACTRDAAGAVKYGFDYIEPAAADIAAMSNEEFQRYSDQVLSSSIRCEAFNSFIRRPELKVVGNNISTTALSDY